MEIEIALGIQVGISVSKMNIVDWTCFNFFRPFTILTSTSPSLFFMRTFALFHAEDIFTWVLLPFTPFPLFFRFIFFSLQFSRESISYWIFSIDADSLPYEKFKVQRLLIVLQ